MEPVYPGDSNLADLLTRAITAKRGNNFVVAKPELATVAAISGHKSGMGMILKETCYKNRRQSACK